MPWRKLAGKHYNPMQQSIQQDLESLLKHTQALTACAEPSLTVWQDYTERRNQLFQRVQDLLLRSRDRVAAPQVLQRLMVAVLEQDQLLMAKVRQHLSKISHEMNELADRRRLFNAYVVAAQPPRSSHLHSV